MREVILIKKNKIKYNTVFRLLSPKTIKKGGKMKKEFFIHTYRYTYPLSFIMFPNVLLMHIIFYIITRNGKYMQIIIEETGIFIYQKFKAEFEFWVEHLFFSYFCIEQFKIS